MELPALIEEIGLLHDKCENFIALRQIPISSTQRLEAAELCIDELSKRLKELSESK